MQICAYDHGPGESLRYTIIYSVGKEWTYLVSSEDGQYHVSGAITKKKPKPRPGARLIRYSSLPQAVCRLVADDIRSHLSQALADKRGG